MGAPASVSLALLFCAASACGLPTLIRPGISSESATAYSPADGLVLAPVVSSTAAVSSAGVQLRLREVDLGFEVSYQLSGPGFLLEPGRYRVDEVKVEHHRVSIRSPVFVVHSATIIALPTLRIYAEGRALRARYDLAPSVYRAELGKRFLVGPWSARRWLDCEWPEGQVAEVQLLPPERVAGVGLAAGGSSWTDRTLSSTPRTPVQRSPR